LLKEKRGGRRTSNPKRQTPRSIPNKHRKQAWPPVWGFGGKPTGGGKGALCLHHKCRERKGRRVRDAKGIDQRDTCIGRVK